MQNRIEELHDELENHNIDTRILKDIDCVREMIVRNIYDKDEVIRIEDKYSVETNFFQKFENSLKFGFDNNYDDPALQVLVNLRDRLYLIAVYKVLKEQGKEIPQDIVTRSYPELLELLRSWQKYTNN